MGARAVVLVLIKGLGIGGAERLISESARFWDRRRFDYRVAYLLPWKDQLVADLEATGTSVVMLGGKGSMGPATAARVRRWIQESRASLVHAHLPATGVLARLVASVPVVYTEHNIADSYRQPTLTLNRITYGRNTRVIAVSDAVARSLESYRGPKPVVIENGVHMPESSASVERIRSELLGDEKSVLVVHVGNIRPHKGHRTLIEATKHIISAAPGALVVSIGGEKFPGDLDRVRSEAAEAGVSSSLRFLGRKENATDYLAAADVVVNPSDAEGLPVALLEAMALARPVVATAVGGVPELIDSGTSGVLVEAGRPDLLATEVLRLLEDPGRAKALGSQASETIRRRHSLEAMVRSVEAVYDEVIRG